MLREELDTLTEHNDNCILWVALASLFGGGVMACVWDGIKQARGPGQLHLESFAFGALICALTAGCIYKAKNAGDKKKALLERIEEQAQELD
jgi:hypothetical protein